MNRSMLIESLDVNELVDAITEAVVARLHSAIVESQEPRLVDRYRQAELLSISVPMLDRLTGDGVIPCVRLGARRLYQPERVIESLVENGKTIDRKEGKVASSKSKKNASAIAQPADASICDGHYTPHNCSHDTSKL